MYYMLQNRLVIGQSNPAQILHMMKRWDLRLQQPTTCIVLRALLRMNYACFVSYLRNVADVWGKLPENTLDKQGTIGDYCAS